MVPETTRRRRRTRAPGALDALVAFDSAARTPLYRQLYAGLRQAMLSGRLAPGARIPSTRSLARDLGLSRNTVELAFAQLRAEGYLDERPRVGTFVTRTLPDRTLRAARAGLGTRHSALGTAAGAGLLSRSPIPQPSAESQVPSAESTLSAGGRALAAAAAVLPALQSSAYWGRPRAFRTGMPAVDEFPRAVWARLAARRWRQASLSLGYGDPAGFAPLRRAIAEYVGAARGARCTAEQVVITTGAQQALYLAGRLLVEPGDSVWMEDPGYPGARAALAGAGAKPVPVPVDDEGLVVAEGVRRAGDARATYVSPSHQHPLGATMSVARRLALLEWARQAGAWVIEDDYDSEFRYATRPLACLQGLDAAERVLYVGTFSKTLFPALRLGYLIAPPALVDPVVRARAVLDRPPPTVDQAVLADFIADGHFARHVRRMRALYAERRDALLAAARDALAGVLDVRPADAGMHLVGWLPDGVPDDAASGAALNAGVEAPALSRYAIRPPQRGALLLGYAAFPPAVIRAAAERLGAALRGMTRPDPA